MVEELGVELLDLLLRLGLADLGHQLVDVRAVPVSVGPLLHMQCQLELLLSQLEDSGDLLLVIEVDWMWDLTVLLGGLVHLDDLVEVRVECLRDTPKLSLALVLFAEGEDLTSGLVVELKELGVGSQGVQDVLADVKEEEGLWLQVLLLLQVVEIGVSQNEELIWGGILLIDDGGVELLWRIAEVSHELLTAVLLLELEEDLLTLVSQISKNLLQKIGRLMLTQVPKVTNILFKIESGKLVSADINHESHKLLKNDHVLLGLPVEETDMKNGQGILPVLVLLVELLSSSQALFWGRMWANKL